ncbi:MAG: hypothetical protein IPO09_14315 [Anaeromyxobacter sp.]|nr:hypothetical protein [Anaeromyxobacter sp.]
MSSRAPGPGLLLPPPSDPEALSPSAALAEAAWQLEQVPFEERRHVLRGEAGLLIDGLLTRVARGQGALEVSWPRGWRPSPPATGCSGSATPAWATTPASGSAWPDGPRRPWCGSARG